VIFIIVEKITARITDKIIALTEGERNESLSYGVGKPEQWEVIHSGVNISSPFTVKKTTKYTWRGDCRWVSRASESSQRLQISC